MKTFPNIIIFSVFQSNKSSTENRLNHIEVIKRLNIMDIPHKVLEGMYKGKSELSILVDLRNQGVIEGMCALYNQESYLVSDSNRFTSLVLMNSKELIHLGLLVSSQTRPNREAYTYDTSTGLYYYTK